MSGRARPKKGCCENVATLIAPSQNPSSIDLKLIAKRPGSSERVEGNDYRQARCG
jgi:hypothetical protein